jgi:hypothetical protein
MRVRVSVRRWSGGNIGQFGRVGFPPGGGRPLMPTGQPFMWLRSHNDSFLVVAAIVSIGALVLDWWVSSTTLESFAVQFGLPPWLLATVVSIIDAGVAVLASGYLAEGELHRERHQKLGLLVMGFLGLGKLIALFFYLQDQYSGRFALNTIPWGIWLQVLLILVVYALLKTFGAGLWYLFALIRHWFPLVLSETKDIHQTQARCRRACPWEWRFSGELTMRVRVSVRRWSGGNIGQFGRVGFPPGGGGPLMPTGRPFMWLRPHNDSFLVVAAIVSIGALVLDWWVSSTTLESFAVQFGLPPWLLATVVSIIDAGVAVLASGYLAEGELRRERHQKLGLLVMGFLGLGKLIALFFYLQDQYSGRFALNTIPLGIWLQVLLILVVYALLKIFGAGLWYLFALIRHWLPLVLSETKEYIKLKHGADGHARGNGDSAGS